MYSINELLSQIQSAIAGSDQDNIYTEFHHSSLQNQKSDIFVTLGFKEISSQKPFITNSGKIYPSKIIIIINILAKPDTHYSDIYEYFDSIIIDRLLSFVDTDKIYTKPLEYNSKLQRLQLTCEICINSSMIFD